MSTALRSLVAKVGDVEIKAMFARASSAAGRAMRKFAEMPVEGSA